MTVSVNDYFKDLPKQEIQELFDDTRAEAFVFAKYLIETGKALRKRAGVPIDQVCAFDSHPRTWTDVVPLRSLSHPCPSSTLIFTSSVPFPEI
jgi:hypothetical protein